MRRERAAADAAVSAETQRSHQEMKGSIRAFGPASGNTPWGVPFYTYAPLIAVAAAVTLARLLARDPGVGFGKGWEQMALARSLVAGRGFADPFEFPTGPTAVLAPLHPLLLALILRIFGDRPGTTVPMLLLETAIQVTCVILLLPISTAIFSSWVPGVLAAGAVLVCTRPAPQWENGMAELAAEIFFLCLLRRNAAAAGGIAGLGWLVSPALIFYSLPAAFFLKGARFTTRMGIAALLVTVPWLARNWLTFHTPVFLRDSFGLELRLSNNDLAGPSEKDAGERFALLSPNENAAAAAELVRLGEPVYFSHLQAQAIAWIRHHPRRFFELTGARIGLWWASTWLMASVSVFAFWGLRICRDALLRRSAASAILLFPLPYYVIQFDPRYEYPILWLLALFAGFGAWRLLLQARSMFSRSEKTKFRYLAS